MVSLPSTIECSRGQADRESDAPTEVSSKSVRADSFVFTVQPAVSAVRCPGEMGSG